MRENVIIISTANEFKRYKDIIEYSCCVVAAIDYLNQDRGLEDYEQIRFEEISARSYDKILLVCGNAYYEIMYPVLTGTLGVEPERICGIEFLDELKFWYDRNRYEQLYRAGNSGLGDFRFRAENENRVLADYRANAGSIDLHYFFQDMIVASQIIEKKVSRHWDIGSRLDGFVSHLLTCGIHTTVIDIRPFQEINIGYGVAKLDFIQADATNLEGIPDGTIESLSALHSIEHFGLGRYGDEINPDAWRIAIRNMSRVLAANGTLYLSVPVGQEEKLCFNAHRVFLPQTICEAADELTIQGMYLVHSGKVLFFDSNEVAEQSYFAHMGNYDCGIFIFSKDYSIQENTRRKISVIIPCYNVEKYIDRCLESIEDQTCGMDSLEVVLVDDVSTDHTFAHLLAFEEKYPDNVLVVSCQENSGPGTARNIGMEYASGEYIAFVDSDDKVDRTMFQRMYEAMESHNCEVVECGYNLFTDIEEIPARKIPVERGKEDYFLTTDTGGARRRLILNFFKSAVWGRLYRRSFLEKYALRFPDGINYGEDNFFSGLVMLMCRSYYCIKEPLYFYYNNRDGIISSSHEDERIRQLSEVRSLFLQEVYRRGFLDGQLDECVCEFEWYMIYKYFIDPMKFILSFKEFGWEEQVQHFRREILKLFPEAYRNVYLNSNPKWSECAELLRRG